MCTLVACSSSSHLQRVVLEVAYTRMSHEDEWVIRCRTCTALVVFGLCTLLSWTLSTDCLTESYFWTIGADVIIDLIACSCTGCCCNCNKYVVTGAGILLFILDVYFNYLKMLYHKKDQPKWESSFQCLQQSLQLT